MGVRGAGVDGLDVMARETGGTTTGIDFISTGVHTINSGIGMELMGVRSKGAGKGLAVCDTS